MFNIASMSLQMQKMVNTGTETVSFELLREGWLLSGFWSAPRILELLPGFWSKMSKFIRSSPKSPLKGYFKTENLPLFYCIYSDICKGKNRKFQSKQPLASIFAFYSKTLGATPKSWKHSETLGSIPKPWEQFQNHESSHPSLTELSERTTTWN